MFRGFNLKAKYSDSNEELRKIGLSLNSDFEKDIKEKLNGFILNEGVISATSIMENWFPQIKADLGT